MVCAEAELLHTLLARRLPADAIRWLSEARDALAEDAAEAHWLRAFSLVPRRLGKAPLIPDAGEVAAAQALRPGWDVTRWSVEQAGRIVILLAPDWDGKRLTAALGHIRAAADLGEAVALALALPLLPDPPRHLDWALEAVRSSILPLFEAVAHANPYPVEQFDERAWNHMILKALFIGSPLAPIQGFARRHNPTLVRMADDFARERTAAGRPLPADIALCLNPAAQSTHQEARP